MKKITVDVLSQKSVNKAIKELKQYKKELKNKIAMLGYRIALEGYNDVRVQIKSMDAVDTGTLLDSVYVDGAKRWRKGKAIYYVIADSEYACFVEFGSGYRGMDYPYPYEFPNGAKRWQYASGKRVTENAKIGLKGWFYPDDEGGWHWTEGQPSRPFMNRAFEEMASHIDRIAKEVFNG